MFVVLLVCWNRRKPRETLLARCSDESMYWWLLGCCGGAAGRRSTVWLFGLRSPRSFVLCLTAAVLSFLSVLPPAVFRPFFPPPFDFEAGTRMAAFPLRSAALPLCPLCRSACCSVRCALCAADPPRRSLLFIVKHQQDFGERKAAGNQKAQRKREGAKAPVPRRYGVSRDHGARGTGEVRREKK